MRIGLQGDRRSGLEQRATWCIVRRDVWGCVNDVWTPLFSLTWSVGGVM